MSEETKRVKVIILVEMALLIIGILLLFGFLCCAFYSGFTDKEVPIRILSIFWLGCPTCFVIICTIEVMKMVFNRKNE